MLPDLECERELWPESYSREEDLEVFLGWIVYRIRNPPDKVSEKVLNNPAVFLNLIITE